MSSLAGTVDKLKGVINIDHKLLKEIEKNQASTNTIENANSVIQSSPRRPNKSIKIINFLLRISPFLLVLYFLIGNKSQIFGNIISYINLELGGLLREHLGFGGTIITYLFWIMLIFLLLEFFLGVENETYKKTLRVFGIIVLITAIPFGLINYSFDDPISNEDTKTGFFSTMKSGINEIMLDWSCSQDYIDGKYDKEECIARTQINNQATIDNKQKINIELSSPSRNALELDSPEEGISVKYNFETTLPITINKVECYTSKNKNEPYYTITEFEDEGKIIGEPNLIFECKNLGKYMQKINKKEESLQLFFKVYYTVQTPFDLEVPILNCQNQNIQNYIKNEKTKCSYITWEEAKKEIDTLNQLTNYNENAIGSNAVKLETNEFSSYYPLHIGDEKSSEMLLELEFIENTGFGNVGEATESKIINIKLPESLKFADENQIEKIGTNLLEKENQIYVSFKLKENDEFMINTNDIGYSQKIQILTENKLIKKDNLKSITKITAPFVTDKTEEIISTTKTNNATETQETIANNSEIAQNIEEEEIIEGP